MRCDNCGYQNVSHAINCIKCNEPLNGQSPSRPVDKDSIEVKKTVIGKPANPDDYIDSSDIKSSKLPEVNDEKSPSPSQSEPDGKLRATINPYNQARFETIEFIPVVREGQSQQESNSFKSNQAKVSLNRENLDPDNPTITRGVQAELSFVDGEWKIIDKSSTGTFLRVTDAYSLKNGDQILMGDRIFTVKMKK